MAIRVTLVGYRASGKTTVGRLLAERLGYPFVDADRALEERLGCPIPAWFAREGETSFREREAACLAELLSGEAPLVLSTGGGVVLREGNRRLLRERGGLVVYLEADAPTLQARLRADAGGRPSLTGKDVAEEVPMLLEKRSPLYREVAHRTVPATLAPPEVAARIAALATAEAR
jgi:shikimate kinase